MYWKHTANGTVPPFRDDAWEMHNVTIGVAPAPFTECIDWRCDTVHMGGAGTDLANGQYARITQKAAEAMGLKFDWYRSGDEMTGSTERFTMAYEKEAGGGGTAVNTSAPHSPGNMCADSYDFRGTANVSGVPCAMYNELLASKLPAPWSAVTCGEIKNSLWINDDNTTTRGAELMGFAAVSYTHLTLPTICSV